MNKIKVTVEIPGNPSWTFWFEDFAGFTLEEESLRKMTQITLDTAARVHNKNYIEKKNNE